MHHQYSSSDSPFHANTGVPFGCSGVSRFRRADDDSGGSVILSRKDVARDPADVGQQYVVVGALDGRRHVLSEASSCSSRLVTTSSRKWRKCHRISVQVHPLGTAHFDVRFRRLWGGQVDDKLVWSEVCLKRYAMTIFSSASFFSSRAMRTSSVDKILHVDQRRQLAGGGDFADLLDERRLVHHVRNAGDEDGLRRPGHGAFLPRAADPNRAGPGLVDLLELLGGIQICPPVGKSGPLT